MTQNRSLEQYFLILIILFAFGMIVFPLAQPVALGFLVALVFNPFYQKVRGLMRGHSHVAAGITTLLFTILIVLPLTFIGIAVVKELIIFIRSVIESSKNFDLEQSLAHLQSSHPIFHYMPLPEGELMGKVRDGVTSIGTWLAQYLASSLTSLPIVVLDVVIFLLSFHYALVDGARLAAFLAKCLPFEPDEIADLYSATEKISHGVVFGSVVAGIIQASIIGIFYWVLKVPEPFLFAALTAISSFVPILGSTPTGIGGAVFLFAHGRPIAGVVMLSTLLWTAIADNIVKPLVLKGAVELHPLLGIISVLGGLAMFGFVGLFLGPLFTAFTIVVLDMIYRRNSLSRPTTPMTL